MNRQPPHLPPDAEAEFRHGLLSAFGENQVLRVDLTSYVKAVRTSTGMGLAGLGGGIGYIYAAATSDWEEGAAPQTVLMTRSELEQLVNSRQRLSSSSMWVTRYQEFRYGSVIAATSEEIAAWQQSRQK